MFVGEDENLLPVSVLRLSEQWTRLFLSFNPNNDKDKDKGKVKDKGNDKDKGKDTSTRKVVM